MFSVSERVHQVKEPDGGYLPPEKLKKERKEDGFTLHAHENLLPDLLHLVVDGLTRYELGASVEEAFQTSLIGMKIYYKIYQKSEDYEEARANYLKAFHSDLNDETIIAASELGGYDICYREGVQKYKDLQTPPDSGTCEDIRTMVKRSAVFFKANGPVVKMGFHFEGAYNQLVSAGTGDYLTENGLWDLLMTKGELKSEDTLKILTEYVMTRHSTDSDFKSIEKIGLFNPRKNEAASISTDDLSEQLVEDIEKNVLMYDVFV